MTRGQRNKILYNPKSASSITSCRGSSGLILQLAHRYPHGCTIAREREAALFYQLLVTSLQRGEIVIERFCRIWPVSIFLIVVVSAVASWHFQVRF